MQHIDHNFIDQESALDFRLYIAWSRAPYKTIAQFKLRSLLQNNCTELWTLEFEDERSPRFRQWLWEDSTQSWGKGDYWLVKTSDLLDGFNPPIEHQIIYGIKRLHRLTSDQVSVTVEDENDILVLSNLGVNFVTKKEKGCIIL